MAIFNTIILVPYIYVDFSRKAFCDEGVFVVVVFVSLEYFVFNMTLTKLQHHKAFCDESVFCWCYVQVMNVLLNANLNSNEYFRQ